MERKALSLSDPEGAFVWVRSLKRSKDEEEEIVRMNNQKVD